MRTKKGDPELRKSCCGGGDCRTSRILIVVADEKQGPVVGVQMEEGRWGEECRWSGRVPFDPMKGQATLFERIRWREGDGRVGSRERTNGGQTMHER